MKRRVWILGLMVLVLVPMVIACSSSKKATPTTSAVPGASASASTTKPTAAPAGAASPPPAVTPPAATTPATSPTTALPTPPAATKPTAASSTAPATIAPATTSPAASPSPAAPAVQATASVSPDGLNVELDAAIPAPEGVFAQSTGALAALKSYRYVAVFSFTGEEEGKPESGSVEVRGAVGAPDQQHVTWKDLETGEEFGVLRVGDRAWILDDEEWNSVPTAVADIMSQAVLVYAPSMSWSGLAEGVETTSKYVGTETVNGIRSRHYASTYNGWSEQWEGEITDSSGDVWIAEAGYPVRYRFTAKGVEKDGDRGSMLWTMELSDVNGPVSIEVPQEAGDAGPVMP